MDVLQTTSRRSPSREPLLPVPTISAWSVGRLRGRSCRCSARWSGRARSSGRSAGDFRLVTEAGRTASRSGLTARVRQGELTIVDQVIASCGSSSPRRGKRSAISTGWQVARPGGSRRDHVERAQSPDTRSAISNPNSQTARGPARPAVTGDDLLQQVESPAARAARSTPSSFQLILRALVPELVRHVFQTRTASPVIRCNRGSAARVKSLKYDGS